MKLRKLFVPLMVGTAGVVGYAKKDLLKGIYDLEKPQGDLFTRVEEGSNLSYLSKNDSNSEEMLKDWVLYNGWTEADRVGAGYFYLNDNEETLLLNREPILGGRYLLWRASRAIEA